MKQIFFIFFIFLFLEYSCHEESSPFGSVCMHSLPVIDFDSSYVILLGRDSLFLINSDVDSIYQTAAYFRGKEKVILDFPVFPPYLANASFCELKDVGNVLILESHPIGASGMSANIVDVNILFFDRYDIDTVLSYNSFFVGIESLKYSSGSVVVDVYEYKGDFKEYPICCRHRFFMNRTGFMAKQLKEPSCFIYKGNEGFEPFDESACDCSVLLSPYVF